MKQLICRDCIFCSIWNQQLFYIYIRVGNQGNLVNRLVGVDEVGYKNFFVVIFGAVRCYKLVLGLVSIDTGLYLIQGSLFFILNCNEFIVI